MTISESVASSTVQAAQSPCWSDVLHDGSRVAIRPITPADEDREREFILSLSPQSRRFRFLGQIGEPSEQLLKQLTAVDYIHDAAYAAQSVDDAKHRLIGVARFCMTADHLACECAVAVLDNWQHRGLGTVLMKHLIDVARKRGIKTMFSIDSAENNEMHELAKSLGFTSRADHDDPTLLIHTLRLSTNASE